MWFLIAWACSSVIMWHICDRYGEEKYSKIGYWIIIAAAPLTFPIFIVITVCFVIVGLWKHGKAR